MSKLSFKEFMKLSEKEKCKKYKDLSDNDKFLARISQPLSPICNPRRRINKRAKRKNKKNERRC